MIKKLTARIGQYKKQTIATPLFMVGEVGMEVLIPLIMSWLIDRGIERGDMSQIWVNGLLLLAAAFISLFFGVMGGRMAATASAGFAKNLRHDMYYTIQDYSFANIDKFSTSSAPSGWPQTTYRANPHPARRWRCRHTDRRHQPLFY